ncbi:hypothetical protein KL938_004049 [Ogataea parapolymorpha]|nr:hypothetical protein KL938_004049 [Ogataea parapolymorpha]
MHGLHLPTNNSPKNGFRGFFSPPSVSAREQYWLFRVEMNQRRTATMCLSSTESMSLGSCWMKLGARNRSTCSDQYWEYSTKDVGERINGGAVNDDKSPL